MTYRYFHTKLSRWRKRYRKLDAEASATLLQRATGKTLGGLCDLARRLERLGKDGNDMIAAALELGIRPPVMQRLFGELKQLENLSRALCDLAEKLFGDDITISLYWVDETRFRAVSNDLRLTREMEQAFATAAETESVSV